MSLRAFNMGCNLIAFEKDNKVLGMICAWATQVDYDKIGMLIGEQSVTGNALKIKDIVGVSALAEGQEDIALKLGENHSNEGNKFEGISFEKDGSAIYFKDAKVKMYCEVEKIMFLDDTQDKFVVLKVIKHSNDKNKKFLPLEAVYPED